MHVTPGDPLPDARYEPEVCMSTDTLMWICARLQSRRLQRG